LNKWGKLLYKEIAENIINSLNSELNGFVIDKRLINVTDLNKLLNMSGLEKIIKRVEIDNIITLFIDESSIENKCLYDGCSTIQDTTEKKKCIKECLYNNIKVIKEETAKNLRETAKNLEI